MRTGVGEPRREDRIGGGSGFRRGSLRPIICKKIVRATKPLAGITETQPNRFAGGNAMNRDFEFKQLLRAYRAGIITEATFEAELAEIERGAGTNGNGAHGGFEAMGKTYGCERDAVVAMLDRFRAGEAGGHAAFGGWEKTVSTECIR